MRNARVLFSNREHEGLYAESLDHLIHDLAYHRALPRRRDHLNRSQHDHR